VFIKASSEGASKGLSCLGDKPIIAWRGVPRVPLGQKNKNEGIGRKLGEKPLPGGKARA